MKSSVRTQPCSSAQSAKKPLRFRVSPLTLLDAICKKTTKKIGKRSQAVEGKDTVRTWPNKKGQRAR